MKWFLYSTEHLLWSLVYLRAGRADNAAFPPRCLPRNGRLVNVCVCVCVCVSVHGCLHVNVHIFKIMGTNIVSGREVSTP